MGMLKDPDPWSGERSRRGKDRPDEPIEEYEPDELPVRAGYWANYSREVGICLGSVVVTVSIGFAHGHSISLGGFRGLLYIVLFLIFGFLPAVLPFVWYHRYRRLNAIYQEKFPTSDENSGSEHPRQLDDEAAE